MYNASVFVSVITEVYNVQDPFYARCQDPPAPVALSDRRRTAAARAGAEILFLPAYSPDLNPIEKMWSKVKACLRAAEARTQADLVQAIGAALQRVSGRGAMSWFASCGYSFI